MLVKIKIISWNALKWDQIQLSAIVYFRPMAFLLPCSSHADTIWHKRRAFPRLSKSTLLLSGTYAPALGFTSLLSRFATAPHPPRCPRFRLCDISFLQKWNLCMVMSGQRKRPGYHNVTHTHTRPEDNNVWNSSPHNRSVSVRTRVRAILEETKVEGLDGFQYHLRQL